MTSYGWNIKKNQDKTYSWTVTKKTYGQNNKVIITVEKEGICKTKEQAKSDAIGLSWYLNRS